jgi:hypothetical protein
MMTFDLSTASHGHVNSGFFSIGVEAIRIGEYCFPAKPFYDVIKFIAETPDTKKVSAVAYSEELTKKVLLTHAQEAVALEAGMKVKSSLPLLADAKASPEKRGILKQVARLGAEKLEGSYVDFEVAKDASQIRVGKYVIGAKEFSAFSNYLVNGGWLGWPSDQPVPEYAEAAKRALATSQNRLFQSLKEKHRTKS